MKERVKQRKDAIEKRVAAGEFDQESIDVGLKAFHGVCDRWAIEESEAQRILFDQPNSTANDADLLERISYTLRIYKLANDVIQGDYLTQQNWLRRAQVPLDGKCPIDLMKSGPIGCAKVMSYLEHAQL